MAIAGTLEIQMMANLARLQKDMDDAKRMVGGSMASIEKSIKSVMGLFGVGFGVNYFIGLVDSSIEAQDHLNDLKKSTGLAITELAGLKLAAAQSGADLNSIADSINKLSVNIGKDAERFKALGITAKDPLQAFKQLADIFVMIDDPQQRAALAAAALGKSWAGAAPLLGEGGARIQEMVDKGALLSGVTQESADQADQYKDRLAELQTSMGAVTTRMVGELLPGLNDIANAMREASKEGSILLTIWVGMGGVMANLLGMSDAQKTTKRLQEINDQLVIAQKQLAAGSLKPEGTGTHFFSFLIPDVKLGEEALAKIRMTIKALEAERDRLSPKPAVVPPVDTKANAEAAKRAAEFLKNAQDQQKAYDALLAKIKEYDAQVLQELDTGKKSTEADKLAIAVKEKLNATQQASMQTLLAKVKADETALIDAREFNKLEALATGRRAEENDALDRNLQSIRDGNKAMRESTAEIGLSADALTALKLARIDDTIAIEQRKLAILESSGLETEEIVKIRQTIAALEDRKVAVLGQAAANMKNVLSDSITAGIMEGFNHGSSALKAFENTAKNMAKTMILEPQIKAAVQQALPIFEFKDTALIANTAALNSLTVAVSGNTANQTATKTDWGSTWGWVIAILMVIYKAFETLKISASAKYTQGTATRTGFTGQYAIAYARGDNVGVPGTGPGAIDTRFGTLGTLASNKLNDATLNIIETYARAGDQLGILDARTKDFTATINTSGDVVDALSTSIGSSLVPAIQLFQREGETLQQTAVRLTETFRATNDFINALGVSQGDAFGGFGLGSTAGRDALIAASGGLSEFTSNAQAFVKNFLTPAQQLQPALDDVGRTFARLGIQGVSTNEQFAELVRQQMALGHTDVVAQLLSVSDSFNQVTKSAADASKQIKETFNQDMFSTLVDYNRAVGRALNRNQAGASVDIAAATKAAAAKAAAEAAGTAAYAAKHQFTTPSPIEDLSQSGFATFWEVLKELFSWLWEKIKDLPGMIWDFMKQLPGQMWEYMKQLPQMIFDAIKDLFGGGLPGVGGGGGGLPSLPSPGDVFGFANGGAFTNGIYSSPTPFRFANGGGFSLGVMGEASPEAVMPLRRAANGMLGVLANNGNTDMLVAEIRALRQEVAALRSSSELTARSTKKTSDLLTNVTQDGQSLMTTPA